MSFATLLSNTCTIRRKSLGAADAHGHAVETWADSTTGVPCRLVTTGGNEKQANELIVIADYKLICGSSVDVTERDRIEIDSVEYDILLVSSIYGASSVHHQELKIRMIR